MIRDIASFLSWIAIHKEALLCYATDDCDCTWVAYSEKEVEVLLIEYKERVSEIRSDAGRQPCREEQGYIITG